MRDDDSPDLDATDFAHPAWWRGHDYAMSLICADLRMVLAGEEPAGTCAEPYESVRRAVWELVTKKGKEWT